MLNVTVVGVILMVVITVALAAVVGVVVFDSGEQEQSVQAGVDVQETVEGGCGAVAD